ncbi:MAG: tetratricopeptide repeat protein, partial [Actinomycetota bacterium]|nr:tetratricopeptide repeat protein [Actinomycetota bacterium]
MALLALVGHDALPDEKTLHSARQRLPQLADYTQWFSASAAFASQDFEAAARHAEAVLKHRPKSPLIAQAAFLAAKAYIAANHPEKAVAVLGRAREDLPQPEGDLELAGAFEAARDRTNALACYRRIWLEYPASSQAMLSEPRLAGAPPAASSALLVRATKLMEARAFDQARRDFTALAASSAGLEHDFALVRTGAVDQRANRNAAALSYLQALTISNPEADAERLYYILAAARRLNRLDDIQTALAQLTRSYPRSEWRLRALAAAGDEYFVLNQPADFEPLYTACFEQFPTSTQAAYCHWRVAFSGYLLRRENTAEMMRSHLRRYPESANASAAMYFLGRMAERESQWAEARAWYDQVESWFPNYYYGFLARARRAQTEVAKASPSKTAAELLEGSRFPTRVLRASFEPLPSAESSFERARLLRSAALDEFAEMELKYEAKSSEQPEAFGLELARMAAARSAPDRAIRYLKRYAPGYL